MDYSVVLASIIVFLIITFLLVGMLLGAKAKLLPSGPVSLLINGENKVEVSSSIFKVQLKRYLQIDIKT